MLFIVTIIALVKSKLVLFLIAAVMSFDFFLRINTVSLDLGILGSILDSNVSESLEYLGNINKFIYIKTLLFFYLFFLSLKITIGKINLGFYAIMLLVFSSIIITNLYKSSNISKTKYIHKNYLKTNHHEVWFSFLGLISIVKPLSLYYELSLLEQGKSLIISEWSEVYINKKVKDIYIVNIGESVIKDYFPSYNDNLGRLDRADIFNGVISPSVVTRFSVPRILSKSLDVNRYNNNLNIIDLANDAGMKTYWLSNQAKIGQHETQVTSIANRAHYQYYQNTSYEKAKPDKVLLPEVIKAIRDKTNQPKVIFIHTIGSHYDFCQRFDREILLKKSDNKYLECYSKSVAYGVAFIEEIRELLTMHNKTYKIIYFSDHGLTPVNVPPYLIHGIGSHFSRQAVEVPFIAMSDDPQETKMYSVKYNLRDFSDTFAQWIGISSEQTEQHKSIFNTKYIGKEYDSVLTSEFKIRKID
ncbi:PE--lipooligosaccharide phosphorylethanolaminetransferase [Vibrio lentus]|uniref:PE--lipooligosaccharide phosphorylethanolaminetransferase n=1 Tax=Vibrio lentus TaxID=136468 RepID=A0A2N7IEZ4_9VIBR|nr:PE--lipooligosaccharide phosphorylethanolaminetransferase [Vibrio lentus]PMK64774.1 PE--lipooligosaccharide phosphorylethanolaminetransferase [Vibrio lentus]PML55414.1 PE--lipooligosaccharide phosphorylethanolaminetransferase [Vibrio lentus]PMM29114.1 PE--lipooligosaccharide phosphorylethanolaminetransferase [Vibrio lentus]